MTLTSADPNRFLTARSQPLANLAEVAAVTLPRSSSGQSMHSNLRIEGRRFGDRGMASHPARVLWSASRTPADGCPRLGAIFPLSP